MLCVSFPKPEAITPLLLSLITLYFLFVQHHLLQFIMDYYHSLNSHWNVSFMRVKYVWFIFVSPSISITVITLNKYQFHEHDMKMSLWKFALPGPLIFGSWFLFLHYVISSDPDSEWQVCHILSSDPCFNI